MYEHNGLFAMGGRGNCFFVPGCVIGDQHSQWFCIQLYTFYVYFIHFLYHFLYTVLNFFTGMTLRRTKLNHGQVLAAAVEATGLNKEDVARKAGYSRSAYYKHIENPDLDFHILIAYGKAINHDFTNEFPEMPKYLLEEPDEIYGKPATLEEALKLLAQWKDKYLDLLEKYKALMEEKMAKK
ncbi:MAG TPA: helix-turn-helix transcriptional regulator [Chitinophagaceae bacterium]|nr:helix-turn-helix transcriptional regulator [Chitinophagaceae bacterium]